MQPYADRISAGVWGGGFEIAAFATMTNTTVHVYERVAQDSEDTCSCKEMSAFEEGAPRITRILFQDNVQYDDLQILPTLGRKHRNKEKAEPIFLDVMSYSWTLVPDPQTFRDLRELYIEAGRGLIQCRAGRLKDLRNTYFVPATDQELRPFLEKAIQDAE